MRAAFSPHSAVAWLNFSISKSGNQAGSEPSSGTVTVNSVSCVEFPRWSSSCSTDEAQMSFTASDARLQVGQDVVCGTPRSQRESHGFPAGGGFEVDVAYLKMSLPAGMSISAPACRDVNRTALVVTAQRSCWAIRQKRS